MGGKKGGGKGHAAPRSRQKMGGKNVTHPVPFKQASEKEIFCLAIEDDNAPSRNLVETASGVIDCPLCVSLEPCAAVSVSCGHWACYKCILRVRFLGEDSAPGCPICKVKIEKIIVTTRPELYNNSNSTTEGLSLVDMVKREKISFDPDWLLGYDDAGKNGGLNLNLETLVNNLFAYKCWTCISPDFRSFNHLQQHMERFHSMFFCRTCLDGREIFLQEHMCYRSKEELDLHCRIGDSGLSGQTQQSQNSQNSNSQNSNSEEDLDLVVVPILPHAKCDFCRPPSDLFYTHEALWKHMRSEHFFCHLCYETHKKNEFFKTSQALFNHYCREHHVCPAKECLKQGIFSTECVFGHELQLEHHFNVMHAADTTRANGRVQGLPREKCEDVVCQLQADAFKNSSGTLATTNGGGKDRVSIAWNGHSGMEDAETLSNLSPNERPIYFLHMREDGIRKAPAYIVLPQVEKRKAKDRFPDMDYGIAHFKPEKRKTFGTTEEDSVVTAPDQAAANQTQIYAKAKDYERDLQAKMISELPAPLFDLPCEARMDTTLGRPSFLRAIDTVLECAVGDVISCKIQLVSHTADKEVESSKSSNSNKKEIRISFPRLKAHVASLNPLQLDSLSEMRTALLAQTDTRLDLDKITSLRPLFFRTLRSEDNVHTSK